MAKIFLLLSYTILFCYQDIKAGKVQVKRPIHLNESNKYKKPKKDVFETQEKNISYHKDDKTKIQQREQLINALEKSVIYLNALDNATRSAALQYKTINMLIASELAVFGSDIEITKISINNCISFLKLGSIDMLVSLSAENMANWIKIINKHLKTLNERKILLINIEDHCKFIQEKAKKIQNL